LLITGDWFFVNDKTDMISIFQDLDQLDQGVVYCLETKKDEWMAETSVKERDGV
jgi:hypothetical protein